MKSMKKLLMIFIWLPASLITLIASLSFYIYRYQYFTAQVKNSNYSETAHQLYNFFPKVLGFSIDIKYEKVRRYLEKYKSPMRGTSQALVEAADIYDIDPFLIVAIAQCETNLGKKSPEDCFNPFGLGIYGKKKTCFENWEESYQTMAKTLRKKYFDLGLTTPEEIMEKYCPVSIEKSDGHWAKCVNRFKKDVEKIDL